MERSPLINLFSQGFLERSFSTLVLIPIVIMCILLGPPYSDLLIGFVSFGLWLEWGRICLTSHKSLFKRHIWFCLGILYSLPALGIFWRMAQTAPSLFLGICCIVWASDVGAYLVGQLVRGPKLLPKVSPNKTWSGVLGGFVFAFSTGIILIYCFHWSFHPFFPGSFSRIWDLLWVGGVACLAQVGDFLESWMKRRFHLKDTSHLIPGHGGLWDRLDSFLAVGLGLWLRSLFGS